MRPPRALTFFAHYFAKENYFVGTPTSSLNRCGDTSRWFRQWVKSFKKWKDGRKWLRRLRYRPRLLSGYGCRRKFPNRHIWLKKSRVHARFDHTVVAIGPWVVDFTRRQFEPKAAFPFYQTVASFRKEWKDVKYLRK